MKVPKYKVTSASNDLLNIVNLNFCLALKSICDTCELTIHREALNKRFISFSSTVGIDKSINK